MQQSDKVGIMVSHDADGHKLFAIVTFGGFEHGRRGWVFYILRLPVAGYRIIMDGILSIQPYAKQTR